MKLHCLYYSLLFLFPVLCGCVDSAVDSDFQVSLENREVKTNIEVDKLIIELPSADAKDFLQITTNGEWKIPEASIPIWLTISPLSGVGSQLVTIAATENKSSEERTGTLIIQGGQNGKNISVSIRQQGKYLRLSQHQIAFSSNGGSVDIQVETDGVLYIQNDNDWISCEPSLSHLKISATANYGFQNRQAEVYLSPAPIVDISECQVITIEQAGLLSIGIDDYAQDEIWDDKN